MPEIITKMIDDIIENNRSYQRVHIGNNEKAMTAEDLLHLVARERMAYVENWNGPTAYRRFKVLHAMDGALWIAVPESREWVEIFNGP